MRIYRTASYKTQDGINTKAIFYVFSDSERNKFSEVVPALKKIKRELDYNAKLHDWNKYDEEALFEILLWPMHYADGGKMADLTKFQIGKVQKMLNKLLPDYEVSFAELFELQLDSGWDEDDTMTEKEMRIEMDRRRSVYSQSTSGESTFLDFFEV